jgi:type III secretion protein T
MESLFADDSLGRLLLVLSLGLPRLGAAFVVSPFLSGSIFNGQLKSALVLALFLTPAPALAVQMAGQPLLQDGWPLYLGLIAKEVLLGYLLGYVSGVVFWAIQSAGFLMDNQRGASMAAAQDPLSGEETSPLGSLFFQGALVAFFVGGGFLAFLRLLWSSYVLWPPLSFWPTLQAAALPLFCASLVDWLLLQTFLLAGPVVAAALLTDVALGLINRFASQLNVYVIAMPIKSGLTMFILVSYYVLLIGLSPGLFVDMFSQLDFFMKLLQGS